MRRWPAALLALGVLALSPGTAGASVAYISDTGATTAQGEPGEANDMTVRAGGDGVIFTDAAGIRPREADNGCRAITANEVTCSGDGSGLLLGEDGDDKLKDAGATGAFGARGGPGGDEIVGGAVSALLYGDDKVERSTDGDDRITGATQAKPGVTLEEFPQDELIFGGGGNDIIDAREGVDHASGGAGDDTVSGGEGDDVIDSSSLFDENDEDAPGDAGDDILAGDGGNDQVTAINGKDKASGGDGNDYLIGTDIDLGQPDGNADTLSCGAGADRVAPSSTDRVSLTCETLRVAMYCNEGYPCSVKGTITGRAKGAKKSTTIAKLSRSLDSPGPVEFKLGKKAVKLLGSAKKVSVFAEVIGRRGKKIVSSSFVNFHLTK